VTLVQEIVAIRVPRNKSPNEKLSSTANQFSMTDFQRPVLPYDETIHCNLFSLLSHPIQIRNERDVAA